MITNPALYLIRLRFTSPLHLAKGKPGSYDAGFDILHSDTLKAALFAMAVQIYGEDVIAAEQTQDSNAFMDAFRVASGFPYWQQELFFPRLLGTVIKFSGLPEEQSSKLSKGIRFVGKAIFEEMLAGKTPVISSSSLSQDGEYASEAFSKLLEGDRFISKAVVEQRVNVPRGTIETEQGKDAGDAKPYYLERLYFREEAGLFFLLDCPDQTVREKVLSALESLGENGVGLDRNTGNGHFELETQPLQPFNLQYPVHADKVVALSLFCPNQQTVSAANFLPESRYELTKRGGWITQSSHDTDLSLRKKSIYMFAEGSVFPNIDIQGKLVDIKPEIAGVQAHPMWRDGRPIFLPFQSTPAV